MKGQPTLAPIALDPSHGLSEPRARRPEGRVASKTEALSAAGETHNAISEILRIGFLPITFKEQFQQILDVLVSISWLGVQRQGAIFVSNARRELVLVASHSLAPQLQKLCATVPFGRCLCGLAAEERRVIFEPHVCPSHHTQFEGMAPHGHYNIPLLDEAERTMGVIVLYLEDGHQPHPEEALFIRTLGRVVGGILINHHLRLASEISKVRLLYAQRDLLEKLIAAAEYRDGETGAHIRRMSEYAAALGRALGMDEDEVELLRMASQMHDVGKVGVSDAILLKPGKLTPDEFEQMKRHAEIGAQILSGDHPLIVASRTIALTHHERWNGGGYPRGLKGEEIPLYGRICAIVDVFDALTSARPYKEAWPVDRALALIRAESGGHFDPTLVTLFFGELSEILRLRSIYQDTRDQNPLDPEAPTTARVTRPSQSLVEGLKAPTPLARWDPSLSVGVRTIDDQHRYLINLVNQLAVSTAAGQVRDTVQALIAAKAYTETHFIDEEALMENTGYPDLEKHRRIHRRFVARLSEMLDDLERAPLAATTETPRFLMRWLIEHIGGVDRRYARWIQDNRRRPVRPPPLPS